ncbi:MAG: cation diffusion facilitator family transporter [Actinomycetota bacterium]
MSRDASVGEDHGGAARHRHQNHHGHAQIPETGEGIRATWVSLTGLALTAAVQGVIVAFTGSVALLSDTLHNAADALTAIPLWIALVIGRRPRNRRFTHGYGRAEDLAGLAIIAVIAASAAVVAWESAGRLASPRRIDHAGWVIAAGLVGALGNEWVARYRIRAGRRLGSEALVADGRHARTDALTSLAVVAAGAGALAGVTWADPVAGLAVALAIVIMLTQTGARVLGRMLDAVDPHLAAHLEEAAASCEGVEAVTDLRLRWHGHRLDVVAAVAVDPGLSVAVGHAIAQEVGHAIMHALPYRVSPIVHIDPHGVLDSHHLTSHHAEGRGGAAAEAPG